MLFHTLLLLTFVSACTHIIADSRHSSALCYVFKPLTTVLIAVLAYTQTSALTLIEYWVFAGLFFSLFGDIFLMLKKDYFLQGLVAFFIAHLAYIIAFIYNTEFVLSPLLLVALVIYAGVLIRLLDKHLGALRGPVYAYAAVLSLMVLASYTFWQSPGYSLSVYAFIGALLFIVSDSILAYGRFVKSYPWTQPMLLATYYLAQSCIALSVSHQG
ncbi:lysoplasmalogenase [Pseudoalteromonas ruthenica]|uniref:lysoplasmalogenase n=1 Tax=Pseudoalteromonas ruthenica TaxID=151081 RepID=UPI00241D1880|nr:lysoplasmalogenase [Pseudoalteromonas ruthenica]|tara:strand:- start:76000 stop:76641 length:642 start_codon:yes stop_codon:yes gene_type:complete